MIQLFKINFKYIVKMLVHYNIMLSLLIVIIIYQFIIFFSRRNNNMYFVGVDVGTGSVRAALVDGKGRILKKSTNAIQTWNPEENFYQQSSEDIWCSCCKVVRVRNEKKLSLFNLSLHTRLYYYTSLYYLKIIDDNKIALWYNTYHFQY